ncbi:MAG: alpha/beta hydrolase [Myxococcales bacterium]|nr:alpha/beta hydrolase [Myxococcales bacterium]
MNVNSWNRRGLVTVMAASLTTATAHAAPTNDWLTDCRLNGSRTAPSSPAHCGQFSVPERRSAPDSPMITLSVAVVPSLAITPLPDPLVILSGGPGQSAIEFYLSYRGAFEPVRLDRELVLIDQRGTGASAPLRCDRVVNEFERLSDPKILRRHTRACLDGLPGDPRYYTTSVAVRDLDDVRAALGYEHINLYGVSYGTRVAQHYMRRFPERTRRVVLDGVVHPELILGPAIALEAQRALDALFTRCAQDPACNNRYPALDHIFAQLVQRLHDEPMTVTYPDPTTAQPSERQLNKNELGTVIRLLSYSSISAAVIPLWISEAYHQHNFVPLATQITMVEQEMNSLLALGMHNAVVCTEDIPFVTHTTTMSRALAETYLGESILESIETMCSIWPAGILDADLHDPLNSNIPTLLLSGENDPITPPAYAAEAAKGLLNSTHVIGPAQGHGLAGLGCVPRIIAAFLHEDEPLAIDTSCVENLAAMPFFVDFAGPAQ